MTSQLLSLQDHASDEPIDKNSLSSSLVENKGQPLWISNVGKQVSNYLKRLPQSFKALPMGKELDLLVTNPLFRCLQREFGIHSKLLKLVLDDMTTMQNVSDGKEKPTNPIRELFKLLHRDKLPPSWKSPIKNQSPTQWVDDFAKRVEHMSRIVYTAPKDYSKINIWLGGLFSPEAFVAATRQAVASEHKWSLETLYLRVSVNDKTLSEDGFSFDGLTLYGSAWKDNALAISQEVSCSLPTTRFTWIHRTNTQEQEELEEVKRGETYVSVPVYLDQTRQTFLFSVRLRRPNSIPASVWSQRGTCITVWTSSL